MDQFTITLTKNNKNVSLNHTLYIYYTLFKPTESNSQGLVSLTTENIPLSLELYIRKSCINKNLYIITKF